MDRSKAHPLKSIALRARPLAPHALAWSCDAELAVATDASLYVFLPHFSHTRGGGGEAAEQEAAEQQFSLSLQTSALIKPDPALNAPLCAAAGFRIPPPSVGADTSFHGVGRGLATHAGAALGQVVRLEWSPGGLGCNLRPVLAALLTNGSVLVLGEHLNPRSTAAFGMRSRGFKFWKILWGLGALLPIPHGGDKSGVRVMDERITSFSWAKELASGQALMAYANDEGEIAIMSIQHLSRPSSPETSTEELIWDIQEVARFDGRGPHSRVDQADLDFVPHGSAFSLKWSRWVQQDGYRTATLAYIAKNYVGFRRVTVRGRWGKGSRPAAEVEQSDTTAICLHLSADAFVEWEDALWIEGGEHIARGVISTPFAVKLFRVALTGPLDSPRGPHAIWDCSTAYPQAGDISTNPITGLVVHRPDLGTKPPVPQYSFVRLSATSQNHDWYETNVPEEDTVLPRWAERIGQETARLVPRVAALAGLDSDSDSDLSEDGMMVDAGSAAQVHPYRFRIWGLASSPGGGCTAVLVSKHGTQHPDRVGTSTLLFGRRPVDDRAPGETRDFTGRLTTEGRVWEWMYGAGERVPGTASAGAAALQDRIPPLGFLVEDVIPRQRCVFCDAVLHTDGGEVTCEDGHPFATCAATGLAIMKPGMSRVCGVCGLRSLRVSEVNRILREVSGPDASVGSPDELCGGCGGKFIS